MASVASGNLDTGSIKAARSTPDSIPWISRNCVRLTCVLRSPRILIIHRYEHPIPLHMHGSGSNQVISGVIYILLWHMIQHTWCLLCWLWSGNHLRHLYIVHPKIDSDQFYITKWIANAVGLTGLIAKGYGTITWVWWIIYVIPVLTLGIWRIKQSENKQLWQEYMRSVKPHVPMVNHIACYSATREQAAPRQDVAGYFLC